MNAGKKERELAKKITAWLLLGVFVTPQLTFAAAPIMPDNRAPSDQRPLVTETANGIPLVNITAPTKGGVSKNLFTDFNVPKSGAVLNNSYLMTETKLAGFVQGNTNMAKGYANIIVNEVTSSNPTQMQGFLEVAGNKASVVIANPNGISVDGGGFINTANAVLTTGRPEYTANGSLAAFRVTEGTVSMNGNGLDAGSTDSVAILGRVAAINAGVWANTLHIRTGSNVVSYPNMEAATIENAAPDPEVALDVAAIGGMYARRITMVGTEKGLGVNMAGTISATEAAELNVNGELKVTGTFYSAGTSKIEAQRLINTKTLAADGDLTVVVTDEIVNSSVLGAGVSEAGAVDKDGSLTLKAKRITNDGQIVGGKDVEITADNVTNTEGEISAQRDGRLKVEETLNLRNGKVTAQQDLNITANTVPLDGVIAAGRDLNLTVKTDLTNKNAAADFGITKAGANMTLTTDGKVENVKKLEAGKTLTLKADALLQAEQAEINAQDISITANSIDNIGVINADKAAEITAKDVINRMTGRIYGDTIAISADKVENRKDAALEAELKTELDRLNANAAELEAAFSVDVTAFTNQKQVDAYRAAIADKTTSYTKQKSVVEAVLNSLGKLSAGTIAAREDLSIEAKTILNAVDALIYSGKDMQLTATEKLTNNGAAIEAQGDLAINTAKLENLNAAFSAQRIAGAVVTNPDKIRIDQDGHPNKGEAFERNEFSSLSSGYGAYHNKNLDILEPLDLASYGILEQISAEELEAGETPIPDELIGKTAPNYDYDDPIFAEFGVDSMSTPRPDYSNATALADWDAEYKLILNALNVKIAEYNAQVEQHNQSLGVAVDKKIHNYTIIRSNTQTSNLEVQTTKAGVISAGGNIDITGDVFNENSKIIAGETLVVSGNVNNVAHTNQERKVTFGTTQASYTYKRGWPHKSRRRGYKSEVFMTPQIELGNPTPLGIGQYTDSTGQKPSETDITQSVRDNVAGALDPFSLDNDSATSEKWSNVEELLTSSLYNINTDVAAKYLIETDGRFTNKQKFLSSDYMYELMRWDPERVPKRLGDGFYEQGLIRRQIMDLTGKRYLAGYTSDEESFKALMEAGLAFAKEQNLIPGVTLTKEQIAALTSDIVWLETKTVMVDGQAVEVIYPRVYLRQSSQITLSSDGSLLSGKKIVLEAKEAVTNSGMLLGTEVVINAGEITNSGRIQGDDISLASERDINSTGLIYGQDKVNLSAGKDINIKSTTETFANQTSLNTTAGIAVKGDEGVLIMSAGRDLNLEGATLQALGDQGSIILAAGKDVNLISNQLSAQKDMTQDKDNYLRTSRSTELGTSMQAGGDIKLEAGEDITARAAYMASQEGSIELSAGKDITLEEGYSEKSDDYGIKYKSGGLLSKKTTKIKDSQASREAMGTVLSGEAVSIKAGDDFTVTAGALAATRDVNIEAGGEVKILAAENEYGSSYSKDVKKSGLMGSGIGFTIGSEKRKDKYDNQSIEQAGSTIGSLQGNVNIKAGKDVSVSASDVLAGKDINLVGQSVTIESADNTYNAQEKHEYKKSGLTVSLTTPVLSIAEKAHDTIKKAERAEDNRLKALLVGKEISDLTKMKTIKDASGKAIGESNILQDTEAGLKDGFNANDFSLNIGIGSEKSKSESKSSTSIAQGSDIQAAGDVNITATGKDVNVKGSNVSGEDVSLAAKGDVNIISSENTNTSKSDSKASGGGVGVSFNTSGLRGVSAGYSVYKGETKENDATHTNSTVTASDKLTVESGQDTNIIGGKISGDRVEMHVGEDLNIESQKDSQKYDEKYTSGGLSIDIDLTKAKPGIGTSGGIGSGKTNSDYESVTDQSGIYAGEGGFDITVDKNTNLKGGVIDSDATADKNKLTTGTLTWEDIDNKAEYESKDIGINVNINNSAKDNEKGVTPNIGMPAEGEAESTTKAGVAASTIEITDKENQKQNIEELNRDTKNTLNKLEQIFDKQTVAERKEMAELFGELAYNEIHRISDRAGWEDGSPEKIALHAFVGGIMSELTGSGFLAGASGAAVNEFIQKKLSDAFKDNPDMHQWASAVVGAAVSGVVSGNAQAGASSAASGTKNNILSEEQKEKGEEKITDAATSPNNTGAILDAQKDLSNLDKQQQEGLIIALQDPSFVAGLDAALEENPNLTEYNGVIIKGVDINGDVVDATKSSNREGIINRINPTINSILNGATDSAIYEALGVVGSNIEVVKDSASKFQWAVVTKTGIKYVRKIPLVSGATLVITLNEASKNMSNDEFMSFATKEISKVTVSYGGSVAIGTLVGGPIGTVAGVLAGPAFEKSADMTIEKLSSYLSGI